MAMVAFASVSPLQIPSSHGFGAKVSPAPLLRPSLQAAKILKPQRSKNLVFDSSRRLVRQTRLEVSCMAATVVEEKLGIRIERNPPESRLAELGVRSWSKWGCPVSSFPWTYSSRETCYLLEGKVKVTPSGATDYVEFGANDLVVFPSGMSCTWEVTEPVDKHFLFD